jgi:hypothetical protein
VNAPGDLGPPTTFGDEDSLEHGAVNASEGLRSGVSGARVGTQEAASGVTAAMRGSALRQPALSPGPPGHSGDCRAVGVTRAADVLDANYGRSDPPRRFRASAHKGDC